MADDPRFVRRFGDINVVLQMLDDMSDGEMDNLSDSESGLSDMETGENDSDNDVSVDSESTDRESEPPDSDSNNEFVDAGMPIGRGRVRVRGGRGRGGCRVAGGHARGRGRGLRVRGRHGLRVRGGHVVIGARGRNDRDRSRSPIEINPEFNWQQHENARVFHNFEERTGPQKRYLGEVSVLQLFEEYFIPEVWTLIVNMTNLNAATKHANDNDNHKWNDTSIEEMKTFFGLVIAMGIMKLPRLELYWQKKYWIFDIPSFNKIMSRNRFSQIWRFLHFCDEANIPAADDPNRDKLFKVRPMLDLLLPRFQSVYVPSKNISIDESMIPFKGRIGFRQFIATKRVRFGIKVWVLAESDTGYISRLQVYTGRVAQNITEHGLATRVVNDLIAPYAMKGYHLYLDNFYTSPALFQSLFDRHVYACGTLRKGRRSFPRDILIENPRAHQRGYTKWTMAGPVLAQSWLDSKPVYFLSTIHESQHAPDAPRSDMFVKRRGQGVEVPCPPLLHQYNIGMGGVDFNDHQRKYYNLGRRSSRWYRRVFFYLLEVTLHNTQVLHAKLVPRRMSCRKDSPLEIRMELVDQLVAGKRADRNVGRPRSENDATRLQNVGGHMPIQLDKALVCKVCSKRISEKHRRENIGIPKDRQPKVPYVPRTHMSCEECQVPLCISKDKNCFRDWHMKVEYWR